MRDHGQREIAASRLPMAIKSDTMNELVARAAAFAEQLVDWRRSLHADPELSGQEERTARFVVRELKKLGLTPRERVGGGFGVTADLLVDSGPPAVALRADMDALPISEETGLSFASRNPGVMHACGHDAHTAMLLGAARLLVEKQGELRRGVRFIFQPHEEVFPGGAPQMIADGALDHVESVFGIHIASQLALGVLGAKPGPFMAAINQIDITIHGRGGHAAMPEQCVDPVVVAAQVILAMQAVVSRSIAMTDAAVVSVTKIEAGTADNIIPDQVRLGGTIRTFDERVRETVCKRVREIVTATAQAFGATADVTLHPGYPVLVNDEAMTQRALQAANAIGFAGERVQALPLQGGGEDFAYYCQKRPGVFVFLGARNEQKDCKYPHHHPRFNIDEDALPWGAALYAHMGLHGAGGNTPNAARAGASSEKPKAAPAVSRRRATRAGVVAPTTCPRCAAKLQGVHCKLICANCGYREDCSDLFSA